MKNIQLKMIDFLKAVGDPLTFDGLWTMRFTPQYFTTPITMGTLLTRLKTFFDKYIAKGNIQKMLVFEEGNQPGEEPHVHCRMVTSWKTPASIRQNLYTDISGVKGSDKCKAYSLHDCKAKDTYVWKSTTYIAKLNQLRLSHGYTNVQLALILKMGRKWGKIKGPIYKQIVGLYNLDKDTAPEDVVESIFEYYELKEKDVPTLRRCKELAHAIMMQISPHYRANTKCYILDFINDGLSFRSEAEAQHQFSNYSQNKFRRLHLEGICNNSITMKNGLKNNYKY